MLELERVISLGKMISILEDYNYIITNDNNTYDMDKIIYYAGSYGFEYDYNNRVFIKEVY